VKRLLVLSGKGGTGKTTVASALIRLADSKRFADCDVDAPNLHLTVEMPEGERHEDSYGLPRAEIDQDACARCGTCTRLCRFHAVSRGQDGRYVIEPAACEGCGLCEYACEVRAVSMKPARTGTLVERGDATRFYSGATLQMGSGNSGKLVSAVKKRLADAGGAGVIAVLDGSPGIGCPVIASVSGVDLVLIVAEPTLSGLSDMERILSTAAQLNARCAVCVNKSDVNEEIAAAIEAFCARETIPFLGRIPYDPGVAEAVNAGIDIIRHGGAAARAVEEIYVRVSKLLTEGADG
jgi:MinD superfamily P-loop ATPase